MFTTSPNSNRTNTLTRLPYEQRHWPLQYGNDEGTVGEIRYPINYEELYNLKGRLLTLIDATYTDPQQRKAQKDIVWRELRAWMEDIEQGAYYYAEHPESGEGGGGAQNTA